jgi:ubiquitin-protein ligase
LTGANKIAGRPQSAWMAASSASAEAIARLQRERKDWRKDRPPNFVAKPQTLADGSSNLFAWDIKIPAKPSSIWAPGRYAATMTFKPDYPQTAPVVKFKLIDGKPLFHPNVYEDGGVCLDLINPPESTHGYGKGGTWKPTLNFKTVLLALQTFLDEPNMGSPAQQAPYKLLKQDEAAYKKKVSEQVAKVEHCGLDDGAE